MTRKEWVQTIVEVTQEITRVNKLILRRKAMQERYEEFENDSQGG